jgi:hypothetical protein
MMNVMSDQGKAPTPSTLKTYAASCHCGAVRFEARLDLRAGAGKCNCSICKKTNFLGAKVKPEDFKQLSGADALTDYQFNSKSVHHFFCARCGVQTFGHANIPQAGGEYYSVNVHCLDGADITDLSVRYCDGLNNNWWNEAPAFP